MTSDERELAAALAGLRGLFEAVCDAADLGLDTCLKVKDGESGDELAGVTLQQVFDSCDKLIAKVSEGDAE